MQQNNYKIEKEIKEPLATQEEMDELVVQILADAIRRYQKQKKIKVKKIS